jgi:hypothetical protein
VPAYTPFNPAVDWLPDAEFFDSQNISRAEVLLDALGLDKRDTEGYRIYNTEKVALPLLVNSENAARLDAAARLRDQLVRGGVELTVERCRRAVFSPKRGGATLVLGKINCLRLDSTSPGWAAHGLTVERRCRPAIRRFAPVPWRPTLSSRIF